jgi:anti-sigma B factor antagonist
MPIQISASGTGRVTVVSLVGDHDLASAEQIRQKLLELSSNVALVVLDFDATTFVDSSVLGVFVGAAKRAARHGNRLIGVNAKGIVLRALTMTGIDVLLDLPPSMGELEAGLADMLQLPPAP